MPAKQASETHLLVEFLNEVRETGEPVIATSLLIELVEVVVVKQPQVRGGTAQDALVASWQRASFFNQ